MLKIARAGCLGLSLAISAQFAFKVCVTAHNREKITNIFYFESLKSFKVSGVDTRKKARQYCLL